MAKNEPKVVLHYVPNAPGEGFIGIPKRDLTERDLARLSGEQVRNATSPHPNGSPAIYQKSPPTGKRAETVTAVKEQAGSTPAGADKDKE
jgi:hypothetical protein